jgi:hypothetical protein
VGVPLHPRASAICRVCCGEIRSACAPISRTPRLLLAVASRSVALCRPIRITRDASGPRSAIKRKKASPSGSVAIASASSITSVSSACGIARSTVSAVAQARCGWPRRTARLNRGSHAPASSSAASTSASASPRAARIHRVGLPDRVLHDATELLFPYPALPAIIARPPTSSRSSSRSRRGRSALILTPLRITTPPARAAATGCRTRRLRG